MHFERKDLFDWKTLPPEEIQKYRHQIINDWKSGLFKNEEIWEKYGMCENTFYELIKRYSEENDGGLNDKSKKPKNPFRKLEEEDVKIKSKKLKMNENESKFINRNLKEI